MLSNSIAELHDCLIEGIKWCCRRLLDSPEIESKIFLGTSVGILWKMAHAHSRIPRCLSKAPSVSPMYKKRQERPHFNHCMSIADFVSSLELYFIEFFDRCNENDTISVLVGISSLKNDLATAIRMLSQELKLWQERLSEHYGISLPKAQTQDSFAQRGKISPNRNSNTFKLDPRLQSKRDFLNSDCSIDHRLRAGMLAHHLLIGTEIPTLECCSRILLARVKTPYDFAADICAQMCDEARHAEFFYNILHANDCKIGSFYEDVSWVAVLLKQDPLHILAVHQRLGECIGVLAARELAILWAEVGYQELANGLELIAIDELEHVRLGERWIEWFCEGNQRKISRLLQSASIFRRRVGLGDGSRVAEFSNATAVHVGNNCRSLIGA